MPFNSRLHLTSPHTKGEDVKRAQRLLKHNRYGIDFMPSSPIDGIYGPATVAATHKAKWLLGYRKKHVNGIFSKRLWSYLIPKSEKGHKLRPPWMVLIGRRRQNAALNVGVKALNEAKTQIGYSPGLCAKYCVWYGMPCSNWCAEFVSWCFGQVGGKFRYAYVPAVVSDARMGRNGLRTTQTPGPGTLVCYDWQRDGTADHIGFFEHWIEHGYSFSAVEGNTGSVNWSAGGQVLRTTRYISQVQAFVEVTH